MKKTMSRLGFTLIELLIVITIIGILAVVFLPTVLNAPAKARDAARQADIGNLVEAIESARLAGKSIPATGCINDTTFTNVKDFLANGTTPKDPKEDTAWKVKAACLAREYAIVTKTDSTFQYAVAAKVEVPSKTGNIACTDFAAATDPAAISPIAPTANTDCYMARSQ